MARLCHVWRSHRRRGCLASVSSSSSNSFMNFALAIWRSTLVGQGARAWNSRRCRCPGRSITLKCGSAKSFLNAAFLTSGATSRATKGLKSESSVSACVSASVSGGGLRAAAPPAEAGRAAGAFDTAAGVRRASAAFRRGTGACRRLGPARTCLLAARPALEEALRHRPPPAPLLLGRHAGGVAEAVDQRPEALGPAAALGLDRRSARRRRRAASRSPPAARAPGRRSPAHRASGRHRGSSGSRPPGARSARAPSVGCFVHAPQHEPAGRGGGGVEVVALGVVAEQLDLEAGVQPALRAVVVVQQARRRGRSRARRAPRCRAPSATAASGWRAVEALAAHHDGHVERRPADGARRRGVGEKACAAR